MWGPTAFSDATRADWLRQLDQPARDLGSASALFFKLGAESPVLAPALVGTLYASRSGWILLSVPNALVRSAFSALHEPGTQLPLNEDGSLNAHISVIRQEEATRIGLDKITDRGKQFHWNIGPIMSVAPLGWEDVSRVWFFSVTSPELVTLRKSYGLPGLPLRGDQTLPFHCTIAIRKKAVLYENDTSKAA